VFILPIFFLKNKKALPSLKDSWSFFTANRKLSVLVLVLVLCIIIIFALVNIALSLIFNQLALLFPAVALALVIMLSLVQKLVSIYSALLSEMFRFNVYVLKR